MKMPEHKFGGDWTEDKLSRLEKYLKAYRHIFTQNERARYFKTWYVDAFAGTGTRATSTGIPSEQTVFEDVYEDKETTEYRDGSAKIALALPEPFDGYLFIEKSKARVNQLRETIEREHKQLLPRCDFRHGDANTVLKAWCKERDWQKERAVVFLDPYGMQVEWSAIEALAATKAIDLWYLFPLGVGVARLLTYRGDIDEAWQRRLDLLFGTQEWRTEFYRVTTGQTDLFGESHDIVERDAPVAKIEAFIHKRLAGIFEKAAKGLVLRNSRQSPLYLLCFAAANKKGAPTAMKIAQDILKED
jgi:three-Cys-motif partner protein